MNAANTAAAVRALGTHAARCRRSRRGGTVPPPPAPHRGAVRPACVRRSAPEHDRPGSLLPQRFPGGMAAARCAQAYIGWIRGSSSRSSETTREVPCSNASAAVSSAVARSASACGAAVVTVSDTGPTGPDSRQSWVCGSHVRIAAPAVTAPLPDRWVRYPGSSAPADATTGPRNPEAVRKCKVTSVAAGFGL